MYVPTQFEETRPEVLHQLIREHSLAALVTLGSGGLEANHIPLELDPGPAPFGTLRGHVARGNPVWRDFSRDVEALAVFQGPQAYISPWYQTKRGRAGHAIIKPTHAARGSSRPAWLRGVGLDRYHGKDQPWKVGRARGSSSRCWAPSSESDPLTQLVGRGWSGPSARSGGVVKALG
jgi:transcriptional regulator